jgi:ribosome-binding factor A
MDTTRQNKFNRLIQKELSDVFLLQAKAMHGVIISVSQVRVSADLSVARAYLSIFPTEKSAELLQNIQANAKAIRHDVAARTRFQLRKMPELSFFIDDSLDYVENIDALLKK